MFLTLYYGFYKYKHTKSDCYKLSGKLVFFTSLCSKARVPLIYEYLQNIQRLLRIR